MTQYIWLHPENKFTLSEGLKLSPFHGEPMTLEIFNSLLDMDMGLVFIKVTASSKYQSIMGDILIDKGEANAIPQ